MDAAAIEAEKAKKAKNAVRTFKELQQLIKEGKIKFTDITAEEKKGLQLFEILALQLAFKDKAIHGLDDKSEKIVDSDDDEWA